MRPPSAQSQCDGSSGYGSTRSQLESGAGSAPPVPKSRSAKTIKGRFRSFRSKRSNNKRHWPQFRSLRAQTTKNKIIMLPIKESSSTHSQPGESKASDGDEGPKIMPKPVPAPRKVIGFSFNKPSAKHTYQNVPIPITPNKISPPSATPSVQVGKYDTGGGGAKMENISSAFSHFWKRT